MYNGIRKFVFYIYVYIFDQFSGVTIVMMGLLMNKIIICLYRPQLVVEFMEFQIDFRFK